MSPAAADSADDGGNEPDPVDPPCKGVDDERDGSGGGEGGCDDPRDPPTAAGDRSSRLRLAVLSCSSGLLGSG